MNVQRTRVILSLAAIAAVSACSTDTTAPATRSDLEAPTAVSATGNGAPSGFHYTLNLVGVKKGKSANMDSGSGSVIFVGLGTTTTTVTTKIMLSQSFDGTFAVLDKNGTDGEAAYKLPAPGTYTVWARALGTPGGSAKITTCAEDVAGNGATTDEVCSTQNEVFVRGTGKSSFRNVTQALTTIVISELLEEAAYLACGGNDTVNNTGEIRVDLFDSCLENYFWKYDNNGLKLLQIRFYPN